MINSIVQSLISSRTVVRLCHTLPGFGKLVTFVQKALCYRGLTIKTRAGYYVWVDNDSYPYVRPYIENEYEPFCSRLVKCLLHSSDVFLDVGAHIGHYTLTAAPIVGSEGRVWAIEPDPITFAVLERNVKIARFPNVLCLRVAIADYRGTARWFSYGGSGVLNSLYGSPSTTNSLVVPCLTLDAIFEGTKVNGIKIDAEGADIKILRGAVKLIEALPDMWMIIELRPGFLKETVGIDPVELLQTLWSLGFTTFFINQEANTLTQLQASSYFIKYGKLLCFKSPSVWIEKLKRECEAKFEDLSRSR